MSLSKHQASALLAATMVLSFTGGMAIADGKKMPLGFRGQPHQNLMADTIAAKGDLIDKLNLSAAQREQIEGIRADYDQRLTSQQAEIHNARGTMRDLIRESTTPRSQLEMQHRQIGELRRQLADMRFQQMLDIRAVLTPTQRAELVQHMTDKYQGDRPQVLWRKRFGWQQ